MIALQVPAQPGSAAPTGSGAGVVLSARGLTKVYDGFVAVDGVDLDIAEGTIHALIGPNGAGKTTCFNLLTGFVSPTSGNIRFGGEDITHVPPAKVARKGLVRSFQISSVFASLSVIENIMIALQRRHSGDGMFWQSPTGMRHLEPRAAEILDMVQLTEYALENADSLPYGRKRILEFATTLALEPRTILLDEPMAGVGHEDVERLAELIRQAAKGRTVLMVEHNLSVVANLSDRVTVLARGKVLAEGAYETVAGDPRVIEAYIGVDDE